MKLIYEANYGKFDEKTIKEVYRIMSYYRKKKEPVLSSLSEEEIREYSNNVAVIVKSAFTGRVVGFSWVTMFKLFDSDKDSYFCYHCFTMPEYRNRPHKVCKIVELSKDTLKNYVIENSKNNIKGIFIIAINKKLTPKYLIKAAKFNYLGKDNYDKHTAYWHFDGSEINMDSYLKWKEST